MQGLGCECRALQVLLKGSYIWKGFTVPYRHAQSLYKRLLSNRIPLKTL